MLDSFILVTCHLLLYLVFIGMSLFTPHFMHGFLILPLPRKFQNILLYLIFLYSNESVSSWSHSESLVPLVPLPGREGESENVRVKQFITARKQSFRKGNVLTHVCHSVHRGGGLSPPRHACPPPGTHHPGMHGHPTCTPPGMHVPPRADTTRCAQ